MKVTQREDKRVLIECSNREARQLALTMALHSVQVHSETQRMIQEGGIADNAAMVRVYDHLRDQHNELAQLIFDEVGY